MISSAIHRMLASVPVLALAFAAQPAVARDWPAGGVTRQEIATWLNSRGLTASIHDNGLGENIVSTTIGKVNFDVYFYACASERCGSLQFAAGWTPISSATGLRINDWNRHKRFIRAYLDDKNNPWGEYDFDVSPGGTREQLDKALDRWGEQVASFSTFIDQ
jgi:hypothetical protein